MPALLHLATSGADQSGQDAHALRNLAQGGCQPLPVRRGYCDWTVDHAGWVVLPHFPEEQTRTLNQSRACCLVWLMQPELGVGPFVG